MSADNYRLCPKCVIIQRDKHQMALTEVNQLYGKAPAWEHRAAQRRADEIEGLRISETLREDYEIGIRIDGTFFCHYGASCSVCGYEFKFEKEQNAFKGKS